MFSVQKYEKRFNSAYFSSSGLGVNIQEVECSIYECIVNKTDIRDAIYTTDIEGLDIIPSHIDLVGAEIEMLNMNNREKILHDILSPIREEYDYILIDCSPSLGLITVNALTAADSVIIPVQCEYFALEGLTLLIETVDQLATAVNPKLKMNIWGKGKYLLRHAFEEGDYLPYEILFREKAAFSDAVGHSMVDYLKEYADSLYSDEDVENAYRKYEFATPFTKESLLYSLFVLILFFYIFMPKKYNATLHITKTRAFF